MGALRPKNLEEQAPIVKKHGPSICGKMATMKPFTISVADCLLADLRERLKQTHWPSDIRTFFRPLHEYG